MFFERESIDGHDWYRDGAEALLDRTPPCPRCGGGCSRAPSWEGGRRRPPLPVAPRSSARQAAAGRRGGKKRWRRQDSPTDRIELGQLLGAEPWASFYAATWLHAVADTTEAVLWIGSDDGLRVWLDGTEAPLGPHHDHSGDDHYRVPLSLATGRHLLLVQVEYLEHYVHFRARLSDPQGRALRGVLTSSASRVRGAR